VAASAKGRGAARTCECDAPRIWWGLSDATFFSENAFVVLGAVLFVVCGIVGTRFYFYPYGNRGSGLLGVTIPLRLYANDHRGWFPNQTRLPLQSLKLLYPYAPGDLAGISGNTTETKRRMQLGLDLDEGVSSLVYFPGLRDDDDPNLMMIYERQEGVFTTGRRLSGHAVGFVGGYAQQSQREIGHAF